jgi:hypothetical protein
VPRHWVHADAFFRATANSYWDSLVEHIESLERNSSDLVFGKFDSFIESDIKIIDARSIEETQLGVSFFRKPRGMDYDAEHAIA